jgi:hypothetical protein
MFGEFLRRHGIALFFHRFPVGLLNCGAAVSGHSMSPNNRLAEIRPFPASKNRVNSALLIAMLRQGFV